LVQKEKKIPSINISISFLEGNPIFFKAFYWKNSVLNKISVRTTTTFVHLKVILALQWGDAFFLGFYSLLWAKWRTRKEKSSFQGNGTESQRSWKRLFMNVTTH
jgi:hypothetical protein